MGHKRHRSGKHVKKADQNLAATSRAEEVGGPEAPKPRMKRKEFDAEMRKLHGELVKLQEWVK